MSEPKVLVRVECQACKNQNGMGDCTKCYQKRYTEHWVPVTAAIEWFDTTAHALQYLEDNDV